MVNMENYMGIAVGVTMAILLFSLVMLGIAITSYILNSLALQTIATRRQVKYPWMAWIPVANYWTIGSIADEYDGRNGIKRKWRVTMLTLAVLYVVSFVIWYIIFLYGTVLIALQTEVMTYATPEIDEFIELFLLMYGGIFVVVFVAVAMQAVWTICSYKIFESTVPEKSVKYMLLSLLVPLAQPICLMKCRYKGYSTPAPCDVKVVEPLPEAVEEETAEVEEIPAEVEETPSEEE